MLFVLFLVNIGDTFKCPVMNKARIPFYQEKLEVYNTKLTVLKKKHGLVSLLRLVGFLGLLISWFYIITVNFILGISLGSTLLIIFFILLKWHKKIEDKKIFVENIITINRNEVDACKGEYSVFSNGDAYIDHNHPYSYDIDLFGDGSLFQYLNRTVTNKGEGLMAYWLSTTPLPNGQIKKNQQAIYELTESVDFRQSFQAIGNIYSTEGDEQLLIKKWLEHGAFFGKRKQMKIGLWILPAIMFIAISTATFGLLSWNYVFSMFLLYLSILGTKLKAFNKYYRELNQSHATLRKIVSLMEVIEKNTFKGDYLNQLKEPLYKNGLSASNQFRQLTKLLDALDNRGNLILGPLLNGFLLWDWQCVYRIEGWQLNHRVEFEGWMDLIAHFDALSCLANLYFNNPDFTFPELSPLAYEFTANDLGHPLLTKEIRVCNDFSIDDIQRYAIITGANMAGKSTFLRTVATNLVLAGCGAPVCASKLIFTPLPLNSSMRTEDSLMKNESYFFAELKRLQRITQALENGDKLFIILDEILRGTNSEDKRKGSIGFVKKITEKMAHGLVATHDLELARLTELQPDIFKALCFEVTIQNNELQFDYKLHPGVTQNMNASFLMLQMGIIDE